MTLEEVQAMKARWFDLIMQIAPHQRAITTLQEQAHALERQITSATPALKQGTR